MLSNHFATPKTLLIIYSHQRIHIIMKPYSKQLSRGLSPKRHNHLHLVARNLPRLSSTTCRRRIHQSHRGLQEANSVLFQTTSLKLMKKKIQSLFKKLTCRRESTTQHLLSSKTFHYLHLQLPLFRIDITITPTTRILVLPLKMTISL